MIRLVRGVALIVGLYLNTHQSAHRLHCSLVSPLPTSRTCCRLQVAVCGCVYCAGPASTAGQAPGQARPRCPAYTALCHSLLCFPLSPAQHLTLDTACWTLDTPPPATISPQQTTSLPLPPPARATHCSLTADTLPCPPRTPWRAAAPSPGSRPWPPSAPWPPCSPSPSHPGTV